jgi:hypothetical protein
VALLEKPSSRRSLSAEKNLISKNENIFPSSNRASSSLIPKSSLLKRKQQTRDEFRDAAAQREIDRSIVQKGQFTRYKPNFRFSRARALFRFVEKSSRLSVELRVRDHRNGLVFAKAKLRIWPQRREKNLPLASRDLRGPPRDMQNGKAQRKQKRERVR